MRSIDLPMTTASVLAFGGATLHVQTWQMQPNNHRCPSKWDAAATRTPTKMEEGYEKIFAVLDRLMHRHGKY
jgi:hypothetical protein